MTLSHKGTKTLKTPRLLLRKYIVTDAAEMFQTWANDPEVSKYLTWQPHESVDATKQLLDVWVKEYENNATYNWVIEYGGHIIGNIGAHAIKENYLSCEIGYCMGRAYWNMGFMTEALIAVIDYLFGEIGFHRIAACHCAENPGSGRVMQKAGMTYEGTHRQAAVLHDETFCDMLYYSILKDEWEKAL